MPQAVLAAIYVVSAAVANLAITYGATLGTAIALADATVAVIEAGIGLAVVAGLSALLAPKPPGLAQVQTPLKQSVPPRRSGYGRARLSGYFMLYEAAGQYSYDVLACHDGRIDGWERYFLNDDEVQVDPATRGVFCFAHKGRYAYGGPPGDRVQIDTTLGHPTETAFARIVAGLPDHWSASDRGDGVASLALTCRQSKPKLQQKNYPNGLPLLSASARLLRTYDPRLNGLTRVGTAFDSAWSWNENPVLALLDYLVDADHGMGLDFARRIQPAIADWIAAANVCDERVAVAHIVTTLIRDQAHGHNSFRVAGVQGLNVGADITVGFGGANAETLTVTGINVVGANGVQVDVAVNLAHDHLAGEEVVWASGQSNLGSEARYACGGVFEHTSRPADIIVQILSSFDGWLGQRGDGAYRIHAGEYYAPTVILTDDHVLAYSVRHYQADEETINQLLPTYCEQYQNFNEVSAGQWDNLADQLAHGQTRSQPMPLPWVPSSSQARRLAKRQMARVSAPLRGTVRTNLYGRIALGERFIRLRISENFALRDIVVEVQKVSIDLAGLAYSFDWIEADANVDAWSTAEELAGTSFSRPGQVDILAPTIDSATPVYDLATHDGAGARLSLVIESPTASDVVWLIRWRITGTTDWTNLGPYIDIPDGATVTVLTGFIAATGSIDIQAAYQTAGTTSDWSATFVEVVAAPGMDHGFGFFAEGLMADHELIGTAIWGKTITFATGAADDVATCDIPATADAVFTFVARDGFGARYVAGTQTWAAGAASGVNAWSPTLVNAPGQPIEVYAPTPADATLAGIRAIVDGTE